ncbi:KilA-N domain-containing protein [Moraxella lacunata]|uniref:KilA-N domain-containing protein n=1 Tax=Moraxella lacunata TaxID=477 RepID=UPI00247FFBF0|nr:KilA-N domain-containing protein [Moraxella lacunata]MDH9217823.1 KilA-N domain-containing protein [Moraxella lacunata]
MNLIISNQAISTHNGLYSLNDLHKVSGSAKKHEPYQFMRNQETKELIAEIESEKQIAYHTVKGGNTKTTKQGTFVCRELVYAYAMWISPKFHLMVIRAFDRMTKGEHIPCLSKPQSNQLSDKDWTNLKRLVWLCENNFKMQGSAGHAIWARLRAVTGVKSPQKFSREHLPILAVELERIFRMSEQYARARQATERLIIRNVLKYGDDEPMEFFLAEMVEKATDYNQAKAERLPKFFDKELLELVA